MYHEEDSKYFIEFIDLSLKEVLSNKYLINSTTTKSII